MPARVLTFKTLTFDVSSSTDGPDRHSYYHVNFLRHQPGLVRSIPRIPIKKGVHCRASRPLSEPYFYNWPALVVPPLPLPRACLVLDEAHDKVPAPSAGVHGPVQHALSVSTKGPGACNAKFSVTTGVLPLRNDTMSRLSDMRSSLQHIAGRGNILYPRASSQSEQKRMSKWNIEAAGPQCGKRQAGMLVARPATSTRAPNTEHPMLNG